MFRQTASVTQWLDRRAATGARQPGHYLVALLFYAVFFTVFFSPVIFHRKLLAIGPDGLYNFLPYFYSRKVLWDTFVFGGFPMMSDPTAMSWYPPARLFSLLPGGWNSFMVAAYVAASFFHYGYVYAVTQSRFAAVMAGLVFGLSGFMMAHLGHAHIVQSAAWVPLLLWALESQRKKLGRGWFAAGSVATAFVFLGGQPQIFFYALVLATAYLLVTGWSAPAGRRRYYLSSLGMIALGVALAAIQILPTAELARESSRAGYSFTSFASHSLPPRQALTIIFPFVFGGPAEGGFKPYFGAINQAELMGYVGLLPLILIVAAVMARRHMRVVAFWLGVAMFALLLALGDATPLAKIIYHIPILNSFRAPARHLFEFTLAASSLSGIGAAALAQFTNRPSLGIRVAAIALLGMIVMMIGLFLNAGYLRTVAAKAGVSGLSLTPSSNRAVAVPILVFLLATGIFVCWCRSPGSPLRRALLLAVLIIDLGSFAWFYGWRDSAVTVGDIAAPEIDLRYRDLVNGSNQRLMPIRGVLGYGKAIQPTLSRLWSVPSADGYNALIIQRTARLLDINELGDLIRPIWRPQDSSLDLMSVRYFFLPPQQTTTNASGTRWPNEDMQEWLGRGCDASGKANLAIALPSPVTATELGVVSSSACSAAVTEGTTVARLKIVDVNDRVQTRDLLLGRDTSEWAFDCDQVRPGMRHNRAPIFSNYPATMYGSPCVGHSYVTRLHLEPTTVKRLEFEAVQNAPVSLILQKLSLIDERAKASYPLDPGLINSQLWRLVDETGATRVFENLRAMPRAWLVNDVRGISDPAAALSAVKSGLLTDGEPFDPLHTAVVEDAPSARWEHDDTASATITSLADNRMVVRTSAKNLTFLITSDTFYPGWQAQIDSNNVSLYRTDYGLRGVFVPAGEHVVQFDYRPKRFYLGATISAAAVLILAGLLLARPFSVNR